MTSHDARVITSLVGGIEMFKIFVLVPIFYPLIALARVFETKGSECFGMFVILCTGFGLLLLATIAAIFKLFVATGLAVALYLFVGMLANITSQATLGKPLA